MARAKAKIQATAPFTLKATTVSVDKGNGKSDYFRLKDGVIDSYILPNARVRVTGYDLGKQVTTMGVSNVVYADWLGERFGVGDGVWEQSDYPPETFSNSERQYGSEYHIFMTVVTLALGGVEDSAPLDLIISAPPGMVREVAPRIKKAFKEGMDGAGDGRWQIKLSSEKKPRTYTINKVTVIPEGAGTWAAFGYDINGDPAGVDPAVGALLEGNVLVADGGMGTFDTFIVRNGNLTPESIRHATDGLFGISKLILAPVRDYITSEFASRRERPPQLYDPILDGYLWRWVQRRDKQAAEIKISGTVLNLHDIFLKVCNRAAELVIAQKLEPAFAQGVDTVLATGGEWAYILPRVQSEYPRRHILTPYDVAHLKGVHFWDLNAYGGLVMAAVAQRAKGG